MDETILYIARHGETDLNRRMIMQGRGVDPSLNENGRRQALALANRFEDIPIRHVYSSTLARAYETAQIVAAVCGDLPVSTYDGLDEMSFGVLEGTSRAKKTNGYWTALQEAWKRRDFAYRVPNGESVLEVKARAVRALHSVVRKSAGRTIFVVTHGRLMRIMLASVLPGYGLERMNEIKHVNTSVNRLRYRNGAFSADWLNDSVHLDALEPALG